MDQIMEKLDQLSELDDAQVDELQSEIISAFDAVEKETLTQQTVDAMTSLADMLDTVKAEKSSREALAQELAQRASEASTRVYGQDGDTEENMEDPASEEPVVAEEEVPAVEDVPVIDEEIPAAPVDEEMPEEDAAPVEDEEDPEDNLFAAQEETTTEEVNPMSEASAVVEEASELATETEEPVTAAADEAVAEVTPEAELAVEETDTSLEVAEGAEAAVEPAETAQTAQTETNMEAPVTAAADNAENLDIEAPADRRPVPQVSVAPVAITAGADIPGYNAGSPMNDMNDVAEAMVKRLHSLRRVNGGDGEQHIVASVAYTYPESRVLTQDAESNWTKIQDVVGPDALVAAGGHQAPFEVKYDIFGFGTTARPVRDALPKFQADRGGIRYILPPVLSSYDAAVGIWTAANDAAQTPSPAAKNSLTVAAASETTVATDAVTLQLQFGNLVTRAYPELVARHNELGLIQHAREAEQNLLAKITAGSTAVTSTSLLGVARDFLVQIGRAAAAYRSRHRLEPDTSLRAIVPSWVKDAMAADLTLQLPGDSTMNAYSEIDGYLAARGIVASYTLDQDIFGSQGVAALLEFPDTFTWWLFAEGTFLMLDGGTLDIGIIRDSTLVGTNDYKMFLETFESVAKVGIEGLAVTSTIQVNGASAAARDTLGGVAAAVAEF